MTVADMMVLALATWRLTYALVFGQPLEGMREALGVGYDFDKEGRPTDRWASNWVAGTLNCHSCAGVVAGIVVAALWYLGLSGMVYFLGILGAVQLIGRWHTAQRPRREWWL